MAKVKFYSGAKAKIDAKAIEDGAFYVASDTSALFADIGGVRKTISGEDVTWGSVVNKPNTFPPSSHTHNYAGSNSVGGSATSAVKLDASAGGVNQPVYFSNGKPVVIPYSIFSSVPAGAVFTDTTYGVATSSYNGLMASSDKTKIDGIESGADKTIVDTNLSSTSTNPLENKAINAALGQKANSEHNHAASNITSGTLGIDRIPAIPASKINGIISAGNLPSYVDDVLEYAAKANFPTTGETGKIYIDTTTNVTYRWGGSAYVEISASLALGTTSSTAFQGDLGNAAYIHSNVTGNPHSTTKANIGLGVVENKTSDTIRSEITKANVTNALGYTPPTNDTNTWIAFKGATASAVGISGYAPAPSAGASNRYFRSDGSWQVPPDTNTTYTLGSFGITATSAEINFVDGVTSAIQAQLNVKAPSSHNHDVGDIATGTLPIVRGGTGASTAASILTNMGVTAAAAELNKLDGVTATAAHFNFLNGTTGNIQNQLNNKAPSSHSHPYLDVLDTRDANPLPNAPEFRKRAVSFDFKKTVAVDSPANFSCTYLGLMSFAPYSDYSGGNAYQVAYGYGPNAVPKLAIRAAGLGDSAWGSWYKFYTSADKPSLSDLGAAASSHTHDASNISEGTLPLGRGGTGATTAVGVLSNLGITTTAAEINFVDGVTSAIQTQLNSKSTNGHTHTKSQITDFPTSLPASDVYAWAKAASKPVYTAAEVGAAPSSHTHSYLPLSGGTLSGNLVANGKINANARIEASSLGGGWSNGRNIANASYGVSTKNNQSSYYPIMAGKTFNDYVWNIGTIGDNIGFYGFKGSETTNAASWSFGINAITGNVGISGAISASSFYGALNGNAATATALTTSAGSHINPIYFSGGKPYACSFPYSTDGGANTVVCRDNNGYINANYINSNTSKSENPILSQIICTNDSDNFYRKASLAHVRNNICAVGGLIAVQSAAPTDGNVKLWIKI